MLRFVLDGAVGTPIDWILYGGLWMPLLIATVLIAGLIILFIKLNKNNNVKSEEGEDA